MAKKNIKLDDLAVMMGRGFSEVHKRLDQTATRQELHELRVATKQDIQELRVTTKQDIQELRKEMAEALRIIADDVHDLKVAMGPLVRVVAALEGEVRNLNLRVSKLERRVGLAR